ncbi:MAG: MoaD family protein [Thermoplasmata archaeon]|nr:MoaD family protein [Thermoplasmata archaeon]
MKLTIELTKPFSDAVGKRNLEMDFEGTTVGELLDHLADTYPKLKDELYADGAYNVLVFVNDKTISALEGLNTTLKDMDKVLLLFPISGG